MASGVPLAASAATIAAVSFGSCAARCRRGGISPNGSSAPNSSSLVSSSAALCFAGEPVAQPGHGGRQPRIAVPSRAVIVVAFPVGHVVGADGLLHPGGRPCFVVVIGRRFRPRQGRRQWLGRNGRRLRRLVLLAQVRRFRTVVHPFFLGLGFPHRRFGLACGRLRRLGGGGRRAATAAAAAGDKQEQACSHDYEARQRQTRMFAPVQTATSRVLPLYPPNLSR